MNTPKYPIPRAGSEATDAFNLDDAADITSIARKLIDGQHPGVLTTVDSLGRPHARWMSTLSFDEFPLIYTLTGAKSRKLGHITQRPLVGWMFSNQDLSLILNLMGRAQIVSDPEVIIATWKKVKDHSHAFFLKNFSEQEGCAIVETTVDHIECTIPQGNLRWAMEIESLKGDKPQPLHVGSEGGQATRFRNSS